MKTLTRASWLIAAVALALPAVTGCESEPTTAGPGVNTAQRAPRQTAPPRIERTPTPAASRVDPVGEPSPPPDSIGGPVIERPAVDVPPPVDPAAAVVDPPPQPVAPQGPQTPVEAILAIEQLKGRVKLENDVAVAVFFNRTAVGDAEIGILTLLPTIQALNVTGTRVTDASLEVFKQLKNLKHLYPAKTQLTDEGLKSLQETLPELKVYR